MFEYSTSRALFCELAINGENGPDKKSTENALDAKRHLETGQASDVQGKSEDKKSEPKQLTNSQKEEESKGITTYFISGTELHNYKCYNPLMKKQNYDYQYSKQRTREEEACIEEGDTDIYRPDGLLIKPNDQSIKTWKDINNDEDFFKKVAKCIAGDSEHNRVKMLKWSGKNTVEDRINERLWNGAIRNLIKDAMASGNYKINFVTHSHGRSVAIQIANKLSELQKSEQDLQVKWLKKKRNLGFKRKTNPEWFKEHTNCNPEEKEQQDKLLKALELLKIDNMIFLSGPRRSKPELNKTVANKITEIFSAEDPVAAKKPFWASRDTALPLKPLIPGKTAIPFEDKEAKEMKEDEEHCVYKLIDMYDLLLVSFKEVEELPEQKKGLIIIGKKDKSLHFRIFNREGSRVVDIGESEVTQGEQKNKLLANLKKAVDQYWRKNKELDPKAGPIWYSIRYSFCEALKLCIIDLTLSLFNYTANKTRDQLAVEDLVKKQTQNENFFSCWSLAVYLWEHSGAPKEWHPTNFFPHHEITKIYDVIKEYLPKA